MKAIVFERSIPRYLLHKTLGHRFKAITHRRWALPIAHCNVPVPPLRGPRWTRIQPILTGICGSDMAAIFAKSSPYLEPLTSFPFIPGHEVVGRVVEIGPGVSRVRVGDRVVLHPALGCRVRDVEPSCDACQRGFDALCVNVAAGSLKPGIQTGYCADTGGGWSESFIAHETQLYHVPEGVGDTAAVLAEPLACSLHAVLKSPWEAATTILILGAGSIGLLTLAGLRAVGCKARILVAARHAHQRDHAHRLGADVILPKPSERGGPFRSWADLLGLKVYHPNPPIGKPTVLGGADLTFDCVATAESVADAVRLTRAGGTVMLVGMPGLQWGQDWTPIWFKETRLIASYAYGSERWHGEMKDTFEIVLELLAQGCASRIEPLVGSPYDLGDYMAALECATNTGRSGVAKTVFRVS